MMKTACMMEPIYNETTLCLNHFSIWMTPLSKSLSLVI